ncbi:MAG: metallophosphoesterase family protein [Verrucomicrobia bacterium]|nr:metallophosphoesterase family protein [Verrucomicrobiota bacterium]MCH8527852.1 metallophosphatase family protein [Kiritimatiellia bacterium]
MKILLISDIHSNIQALEAVLAAEADADAVYCAGDLVDYGPFPREVIDLVRERNIPCVSGNHDEEVVELAKNRETWADMRPQDRHWVHQNAEALDAGDIAFLDALPESVEFTADGHYYHMRHRGAKGYELIQLLSRFEALWSAGQSPDRRPEQTARVIVGHTHIQAVHYLAADRLWLNPGSTSYRPARKNFHLPRYAEYMTVVQGEIRFHRLDYDCRKTFLHTRDLELDNSQKQVGLRLFGVEEQI